MLDYTSSDTTTWGAAAGRFLARIGILCHGFTLALHNEKDRRVHPQKCDNTKQNVGHDGAMFHNPTNINCVIIKKILFFSKIQNGVGQLDTVHNHHNQIDNSVENVERNLFIHDKRRERRDMLEMKCP
jgi:hypothetical protein